MVSTNTSSSGTLIQAENYNNMAGIQTEACTDEGGGLNVGYIDATDWMAYYNINFPVSGTYKVEYRVASLRGGGRPYVNGQLQQSNNFTLDGVDIYHPDVDVVLLRKRAATGRAAEDTQELRPQRVDGGIRQERRIDGVNAHGP